MAINTQTIRIDLNTGRTIPVAFAHQNDTNRQLTFQLYNNGVAFTPSSTTVKFAYKSPIVNGRYSVITGSQMASGTVSGNTVTVTLPAKYTQVSGVGLLTMILTTSGNTLRPVNIKFVCQGSADGDDTVLGASDWPEGLYDYMDDWLAENEPTEIANLKSDLNYNHTAESGYVLRATNAGHGNEWAMVGTPTDAQAATAISAWLTAHPEATTTVQDGAITYAKFNNSLKGQAFQMPYINASANDVDWQTVFVTPEMFGAKGDGVTDDTTAIQEAINSGKTVFMSQTYLIGSTLNVETDNTVIYVTGEIVFNTDIVLFDISSSCNTIFVNKITGNYRNFEYDTQPNGAFIYYGTAFKINASNESVDHNCITTRSCEYVKIGILLSANNTHGTEYNKINFGIIRAMYCIKFECGSVGKPWINENTFTGGRVYGNFGLYVRKGENQTDPFNGNKFYNIGFELLYQNAIDCEFFRQNIFENVRMAESLFGSYWVNFSSDCYQNTINCQSGVYFSQLNDQNDTSYTNIYRFNQVIFPFDWGGTQKTIFYGENQIIKRSKWGWCAEKARLGTESLSIVGASGDPVQHNLPTFGLYSGYEINVDTTNGYCALNLPWHDGYGYGDVCHIIYVRVTGGGYRFYIRINGTNQLYTDEAGYFVLLYLNSDGWKLIKISDL